MSTFFMPKKISSNLQGINSLIRIYNRLIEEKDSSIILDFRWTTWFSGELVALFGAITYNLKYKYGKLITLDKCSDDIKKLFIGNGFSIVISNMEDGETIDSAVKFKYFENELNKGNSECFNKYLDEEFFPKLDLDKDETTYITYNLSEVFVNARTHGETNKIFCCGQKYPEIKKIRFMIVDLGIGIPKNVRNIIEFVDSECIKWSVEKGNTTKDLNNDTGGLGLYTVQEFVDKHNGDLSIISYKGKYNYRNNITEEMLYNFDGTIVYIDFDYSMLQDVEKMFKLIKKDDINWDF